jgi:hypothetical protein
MCRNTVRGKGAPSPDYPSRTTLNQRQKSRFGRRAAEHAFCVFTRAVAISTRRCRISRVVELQRVPCDSGKMSLGGGSYRSDDHCDKEHQQKNHE